VGHVAEIGNSPILTGAGTGQQAVDFEVKIALDNRVPDVRPGLTAKAEIRTAERKQVVAAPMGAVTARKWPPAPKLTRGGRRGAKSTPAPAPADTSAKAGKGKEKEKEGVFVVENGVASFRPVRLGIAGDDAFEVIEGLTGGEMLVTGPFRRLRDLQHGDKVKAAKAKAKGKGSSGGGSDEGGRDSRSGD
jgi:HlyD family secretion protein